MLCFLYVESSESASSAKSGRKSHERVVHGISGSCGDHLLSAYSTAREVTSRLSRLPLILAVNPFARRGREGWTKTTETLKWSRARRSVEEFQTAENRRQIS